MTEGNVVVLVAGAILALLFGYVPGLRQWFEALDGVRKAQVMAGLLLLAAAGGCGAARFNCLFFLFDHCDRGVSGVLDWPTEI